MGSLATSSKGKVKLSAAGKKALDQLVSQTVSENRLPGFSIAVSNTDEQLYASAGGYHVFGDPSSGPVTPESVFWICSMTKLITSIAALQLVEQGKLHFNDPVTEFIPQFKSVVVLEGFPNSTMPRPYHFTNKVPTVGQLFTHSSGLTYWTGAPVPSFGLPPGYTFHQGPTSEAATKEFFRQIQEGYPGIPLVFEPGAAFSYGYSSDVLGVIVEKITGQSLAEYTEQNILSPLGMRSTFRLTADLNAKLVSLNFRNSNGSISRWENQTALIQRYPEEVYLALGGIGVYSTLPDYAELLRHLLKLEAGEKMRNPILKHDTVKTLFEPQLEDAGTAALTEVLKFLDPASPATNFEGTNWSRGFALTTKDWPGKRKAGTGFWSGWAGTFYLVDPSTGIALVAGSQIVPSPDGVATDLFKKVEEIVYANLE